jgi:cytochrome P450
MLIFPSEILITYSGAYSARTLLYAFTMLAMNPSIQETLYQEILSTIGSHPPQYEDFNNLTYSLCVQLETLRLFPPVVTIPKICPQDQVLLGKYKIPGGCTVVLDAVNVHRNPKYWGEDVNEFNPGLTGVIMRGRRKRRRRMKRRVRQGRVMRN